MKLLEIKDDEKEGYYELSASVLKFKKYSFLQVWVDYTDNDPSSPYFQLSMGYGRLLSILIVLWKFSWSFDLCGRNWSRITDEEVTQGHIRKDLDVL